MDILYKRIYELTISEPLIDPSAFKVPFYLDKESKGKTEVNYNVSLESKQIVVTELDMEASITKDKSDSANIADITLYNPSDEMISILEKEGAVVILKAGYESLTKLPTDTPIQFVGQVQNIEVNHTATDIIVKIRAADGVEMLKNQRISFNAPAGAKVVDTIKKVALSFTNIVEGHFALEDIESEVFPTGFSAFGSLSDVLRDLCDSRKLQFSIEDNAIYVCPKSWYRIEEEKGVIPYDKKSSKEWKVEVSKAKDNALSKGSLYSFTPDTVISAKTLIERRSAKNGSATGTKGVTLIIPTYIKFNTVLDRVSLSDDFTTKVVGEYTIASVSVSLSTKGGVWETTLELTSS